MAAASRSSLALAVAAVVVANLCAAATHAQTPPAQTPPGAVPPASEGEDFQYRPLRWWTAFGVAVSAEPTVIYWTPDSRVSNPVLNYNVEAYEGVTLSFGLSLRRPVREGDEFVIDRSAPLTARTVLDPESDRLVSISTTTPLTAGDRQLDLVRDPSSPFARSADADDDFEAYSASVAFPALWALARPALAGRLGEDGAAVRILDATVGTLRFRYRSERFYGTVRATQDTLLLGDQTTRVAAGRSLRYASDVQDYVATITPFTFQYGRNSLALSGGYFWTTFDRPTELGDPVAFDAVTGANVPAFYLADFRSQGVVVGADLLRDGVSLEQDPERGLLDRLHVGINTSYRIGLDTDLTPSGAVPPTAYLEGREWSYVGASIGAGVGMNLLDGTPAGRRMQLLATAAASYELRRFNEETERSAVHGRGETDGFATVRAGLTLRF